MWFYATPLLAILSIIAFVLPPKALINYHPLFVLLSMQFFLPLGIRILDFSNERFAPKSRLWRLRLHWAFQLAGVTCLLIGCGIVYTNKTINSKPHYTTWHGLLGLCTLLLFLAQLIGGTWLHYNIWPCSSLINVKVVRRLHSLAGLVLAGVGLMTLTLGLFSTWFTTTVEAALPANNLLVLMLVRSIQLIAPTLMLGQLVKQVWQRQLRRW